MDEINKAISVFPAPDLEKIEREYRDKFSQENERYEKQKIATQKLYVDTMNLIQQTYDEKIKKEKHNGELVAAEGQLAGTNRQNALKSLTNANIEQLQKHETILSDLEDQKQQSIAQSKADNASQLTPLMQKKQSLTQQKNDTQKELDVLTLKNLKSNSDIRNLSENIIAIESLLSALDYKIILLEETILRNIAL